MRTINDTCIGELEARGSRFIAVLTPIAGFADALEQCRGEHGKANHHVIATRVMSDDGAHVEEQAKDDGEPAGTAGRPALNVLRGHDLVDVGVVVVRYFGGIKLGTGGLARAYGGAVAAALEGASTTPWVRQATQRLGASFERSDSLEREVAAAGLRVTAREFDAAGVLLTVEGDAATLDDLAARYRLADR